MSINRAPGRSLQVLCDMGYRVTIEKIQDRYRVDCVKKFESWSYEGLTPDLACSSALRAIRYKEQKGLANENQPSKQI